MSEVWAKEREARSAELAELMWNVPSGLWMVRGGKTLEYPPVDGGGLRVPQGLWPGYVQV